MMRSATNGQMSLIKFLIVMIAFIIFPSATFAALWYPIQPLPQGNNLYAVDCSGAECVSAGSKGASVTIVPGSTGVMAANDPYGSDIRSIASGSAGYVGFVNSGGATAYAISTLDGYSWAPNGGNLAINADPLSVNDVIWDPILGYLAVGGSKKSVVTVGGGGCTPSWFGFCFPSFSTNTYDYYSTPFVAKSVNGVVWSVLSSAPQYHYTGSGWFSIARYHEFNGVASDGAGTLVAVGGEGSFGNVSDIYTSTDSGVTWAKSTLPVGAPSKGLNDVIWDGSGFLAVGDGGAVIRSADGLIWDDYSMITPSNLRAVAVSPSGTLVTVGSGEVFYSTNGGISWVNGLGTGSTFEDVSWDGSEFVAVGSLGSVAASIDGVVWFPWNIGGGSTVINSIAANGNVTSPVVVAAGSGGFLEYSTNEGKSWTPATLSGGNPGSAFNKVLWSPYTNVFYASDTFGNVWSSSNSSGSYWTKLLSDPYSTNIYSIADQYTNANGYGVVVADSAGIHVTFDQGQNWTTPYTSYVYSIAAGNNASGNSVAGMVAVKGSNTILHSADGGATWTSQVSPAGASTTWRDVHWVSGLNRYVAVGGDASNAYVATSSDGITWGLSAPPVPGEFFYGVGGETVAYAVGTTGSIYSSIDAYTSWVAETGIHTASTLHGIAETVNGIAVAGGSETTILAKLTDTQPPVINAPSPLVIDALDPYSIPITDVRIKKWLRQAYATDNLDYYILNLQNDMPVNLNVTGTPIPVTFNVTDRAGNPAPPMSTTVHLRDSTAPVVTITPPVDIYVASTAGFGGAAVIPQDAYTLFAGVSAVDAVTGSIPITDDLGVAIPFGKNFVTFSATDAYGNTGTAVGSITVWDAQAPEILLPSPVDLYVNATSPAGTPNTDPYVQAYLSAVRYFDEVDPYTSLVRGYNPLPAVLPLGVSTPVDFYAIDTYGNTANASGSITVWDYVGPVITPPPPVTLLASSATGADISNPLIQSFLAGVSATDNVDGVLPAASIFNDAPGAYSLGTTRVNFWAVDSYGNVSQDVYSTVTVNFGSGGTQNSKGCLIGIESNSSLLTLIPMGLMLFGMLTLAYRRKGMD